MNRLTKRKCEKGTIGVTFRQNIKSKVFLHEIQRTIIEQVHS